MSERKGPSVCPLVRSPQTLVDAALQLAKISADDVFADLGCGDGRLLVHAARAGARCVGFDVDPGCIAATRASVQEAALADRVEVLEHDFMHLAGHPRWEEATVVYAYLLPQVIRSLEPLLRGAVERGARVMIFCTSAGRGNVIGDMPAAAQAVCGLLRMYCRGEVHQRLWPVGGGGGAAGGQPPGAEAADGGQSSSMSITESSGVSSSSSTASGSGRQSLASSASNGGLRSASSGANVRRGNACGSCSGVGASLPFTLGRTGGSASRNSMTRRNTMGRSGGIFFARGRSSAGGAESRSVSCARRADAPRRGKWTLAVPAMASQAVAVRSAVAGDSGGRPRDASRVLTNQVAAALGLC